MSTCFPSRSTLSSDTHYRREESTYYVLMEVFFVAFLSFYWDDHLALQWCEQQPDKVSYFKKKKAQKKTQYWKQY